MKTSYDFYNSLKIRNPYIEPNYSFTQKFSTLIYKLYKLFRIKFKNIFPLDKFDQYRYENSSERNTTVAIPGGKNQETGEVEDGKIILEYIDILDIVPKEYISGLKKSLKLFIASNKMNFFGPYLSADDQERIDNFEIFHDHSSSSYLCNVKLKEKNKLSKYITSISFTVTNLSNSMCIIIYRLYISQYAKECLMQLFNTPVKDEERISRSYEVKWYNIKKLNVHYRSAEIYKSQLVNNFIKEIKWLSTKELNKYFKIYFYKRNYLLPSVNIYETNILPDQNNLKFWRSIGMCLYADYSSKYDACLCWTNKYKNKYSDSLNYICSGKKDPMIIKIAEHDITLDFSAYLVASSLCILMKNQIIKFNQKISYVISKEKVSVMKLLKLKTEIETDIYFEKRFLNEFTGNTISDDYQSFKGYRYRESHIKLNFEGVLITITSVKKMLDDLFLIFDTAIDYRNNQQNFRLQQWMFFITIISLVISLAALFSTNPEFASYISNLILKILSKM